MNGIDSRLQRPPLSVASWTCEREGRCGWNVRWRLEPEKGILIVSGLGAMDDYEDEKTVPWYRGRHKIRTVIIEDGVSEVGDRSFKGCRQLITLQMALSVEMIGVDSFKDCEKIQRLVLPGRLKTISPGAFAGCTELKTVYMPKSVESVEGSAFSGDGKLAEVFYEGTERQWEDVIISRSCMANESLLKAVLRPSGYQKEGERRKEGTEKRGEEGSGVWGENDRDRGKGCRGRREDMVGQVKKALRTGGDGRLHILLLGLKAAGVTSKTGDCTFLLFPGGATMMIDVGIPECGGQVTGFLEEAGVRNLDYFILTHPHSDHIGGGMALLNYLSECGGGIGRYYHIGHYNKVVEVAFRQSLMAGGTQICGDVAEGDRWVIDDVSVDVLNPDVERRAFSDSSTEGENNLSMVLRFAYGRCRYLTAGDLYASQEKWLVQKYGAELKADIVKASHHGLPTSSSTEWMKAVSPKVLVACTDDLGCTKVIRRARGVGADYYCTGMDGLTAITMEQDGKWEITSEYDDVRMRKWRDREL